MEVRLQKSSTSHCSSFWHWKLMHCTGRAGLAGKMRVYTARATIFVNTLLVMKNFVLFEGYIRFLH